MADKKKIWLSSPTMNGHEMEFIQEAFDTNWVAPLGANVDGFEHDMEKYMGGGYAAALSSGTAALHLATKLCGIHDGDIVFAQDLTFGATVFPVSYERGQLVFIDSERDTWNMDPAALRKAIEKYPNGKAVYVVHMYGTPCKIEEIKQICDEHNLILVEDAAESLGASVGDKKTGTFGKYNVLSFNGNKIITTSGGGMLLSDDEDAIKLAKKWSTQSREPAPYYLHKDLGYNYRMSNIVAGIGRGQMLSLEEHVNKKAWIYNTYKEAFKDIPEITMNPYLEGTTPNFWLSCMLIDGASSVKPMDVFNALKEDNIETRPIWNPMHNQPVYDGYDYITVEDGVSVSDDIFERGICLPSDIKNTQEDMDRIIHIIRGLFGK